MSPIPLSGGESGQADTQHESSGRRREDETYDLHDTEAGADGRAKKQKFSRSRTACLPCRTRKSKCGALPPKPCPNCIEAHLTCEWPTEDGRSSKARMMRSKGAVVRPVPPIIGQGVVLPLQAPLPEYRGLSSSMTSNTNIQSHSSDRPDWLNRLLSGKSAETPSASSYHTGDTSLAQTSVGAQQAFDLNLPGPSNYYAPTLDAGAIMGYPAGDMLSSQAGGPMDPTQFMLAMSSRLPMVEESSPMDERSHGTGPSPMGLSDIMNGGLPVQRKKGIAAKESVDGAGKIVKISWWRPHGQTAIAPGLKRITLKVRVDSPQETLAKASPHTATSLAGFSDQPVQELVGADGAPSMQIMKHLLDVFFIHFGCQFPFLDKADLEEKVENGTGSVFLLNCIAGMAARFSLHPAIASPDLEPWAYGNVFYNRAKAMLGAMLSVPSRETIAGFVMLAHMSFANDSESELWMLTGMSVRMSIDLGLHINPPEESTISHEDRRLNRLVFYSVLLMDYALSFGVGRQTAFRPEDITQTLPTEEDLHPDHFNGILSNTRSPFAYAAQMMQSYGPLINMLNKQQHNISEQTEHDIQAARASCIKEYNQLPQDMQWNVSKYGMLLGAHKGPIFLHLHLWMHTILASGYLTGTNLLRRSHHGAAVGAKSGQATPNSATASTIWRNSARTIGDILVLSDIINPQAYFAIPFTNQAFFVAGCCYVKDIDQHMSQQASPSGSPRRKPLGLDMTPIKPLNHSDPSIPIEAEGEGGSKQVDLSRALLTSVAKTNIATLQSGLEKQCIYWNGVAWVMAALEKRIEGIQDVDLEGVTEKLKSFVSLPDAGLIGRAGRRGEDDTDRGDTGLYLTGVDPRGKTSMGIDGIQGGFPSTFGASGTGMGNGGIFDFDALDFLSLPFDLGTSDVAQNVTQTEVPLPQTWQTDWFS